MKNKEFLAKLGDYIDTLSNKNDEVKILNFVIENDELITKDVIKLISEKTGIWDISIENTIKFYPKFSSKTGEKKEIKDIEICTGMNCGPRGGQKMYDEICKILKVDEDGVSADGKIKISQKRCFGRCKIGPNISVDGEIFSHMTLEKLLAKI